MSKLGLVAFFSLVLVVVASACTDGESADNSVEDAGGEPTSSSIFHADKTFTTDSFVAAGWKKSKEYDTATVPESTEIWYGFFGRSKIYSKNQPKFWSFWSYTFILGEDREYLMCFWNTSWMKNRSKNRRF